MREMDSGISVSASVTTRITWDYVNSGSKLRELYERGKASQWNASTAIDWSSEIDLGNSPLSQSGEPLSPFGGAAGSPVPAAQWEQFIWEFKCWMVSQFLHGEQGALVATARLVETVPDLEAKFYAASQVGDEARHVEAYSRYIDKLGYSYPINSALQALLKDIMMASQWDIVYLGMQIIVEGLALAAFRLGHASFSDPIITRITELVAQDEARHVAFGVVALNGYYDQLTSSERAVREEFVNEAIHLMSRRFLLADVWERLGIDVTVGTEFAASDPYMREFRRVLFSRIISSLAKLGLLSGGKLTYLKELSSERWRGPR